MTVRRAGVDQQGSRVPHARGAMAGARRVKSASLSGGYLTLVVGPVSGQTRSR